MKRIGLILGAVVIAALLIYQRAQAENAVGPTNLIICNKVAIVESGASGIQLAVTGVSGQAISICGWNITNTGANGTTAVTAGTGSTCTSPTKFSPTFNVSSTSPNQVQTQYATQSSATGQSLCVNPSATTFSHLIWYSQF